MTLDVSRKIRPDIRADITAPDAPSKITGGPFDEVFFERTTSTAFTEQAFKNAASVLKPGGRVRILTAPLGKAEIIERLQSAGFRAIVARQSTFEGVPVLWITARQ